MRPEPDRPGHDAWLMQTLPEPRDGEDGAIWNPQSETTELHNGHVSFLAPDQAVGIGIWGEGWPNCNATWVVGVLPASVPVAVPDLVA